MASDDFLMIVAVYFILGIFIDPHSKKSPRQCLAHGAGHGLGGFPHAEHDRPLFIAALVLGTLLSRERSATSRA